MISGVGRKVHGHLEYGSHGDHPDAWLESSGPGRGGSLRARRVVRSAFACEEALSDRWRRCARGGSGSEADAVGQDPGRG